MTTFIDTNLNEFKLPINIKYDEEYYFELKKFLDRYITHIKGMQGFDKQCIQNTEDNIEQIINSLKLYNNGEVGQAKDEIKKIIEKYIDAQYICANINENYAFRGQAPEGLQPKQYHGDKGYIKMNNSELSFFKARTGIEPIKVIDMLHIPFNKRGLISTQRFSMAGVPCLYLSTASLGCWLELGMPEIEDFQVSSFKIPNNLKILNMCISQYTINGSTNGGNVDGDEYKNVCSLIEIFPLVCATSFRVQDNKRTFKSEYIISQLLMQIIKELDIDGIAYLTKRMEDYYAYPQAVNLAILMNSDKLPPYNEKSLDMYWKRSSAIQLTKPLKISNITENVTFPFRASYVNIIYNKEGESSKVKYCCEVKKYSDTIFSKFDDFLVNQKHEKFK